VQTSILSTVSVHAVRRLRWAVAIAAASAAVLTAVSTASADPAARAIRPGQTRAAVACVKTALNTIMPNLRYAHATDQLDPYDWTYDGRAEAYVRDFQKFAHVTSDGVIGRDTGSALAWYYNAQVRPPRLPWQQVTPYLGDEHGAACDQLVPSRPR
jgi:murein L,D-transpeptidase YcbB/YkuD